MLGEKSDKGFQSYFPREDFAEFLKRVRESGWQNLLSSEEGRRKLTRMPRNPGHFSLRFQGEMCGFSSQVSPFSYWEGERKALSNARSPVLLESGMMYFDSQFSPSDPLEHSIHIISLLFQRTKEQKISLSTCLIYNPDSQQIAIKLTLGPDRSALFDPNCLGVFLINAKPRQITSTNKRG